MSCHNFGVHQFFFGLICFSTSNEIDEILKSGMKFGWMMGYVIAYLWYAIQQSLQLNGKKNKRKKKIRKIIGISKQESVSERIFQHESVTSHITC